MIFFFALKEEKKSSAVQFEIALRTTTIATFIITTNIPCYYCALHTFWWMHECGANDHRESWSKRDRTICFLFDSLFNLSTLNRCYNSWTKYTCYACSRSSNDNNNNNEISLTHFENARRTHFENNILLLFIAKKYEKLMKTKQEKKKNQQTHFVWRVRVRGKAVGFRLYKNKPFLVWFVCLR